MKFVLLTTLSLILIIQFTANADDLFSVSSKERGIYSFDYVVKEVKRENGYSILNISKFQERSASASRWMMCVYNELAILRSAEMWAASYSEDTGDEVILVFPNSNSPDDPAFDKVKNLVISPQIIPTAAFKTFCGSL